ncbi:hypothetical protein JXI42_08450, partial [bacterium]|nr:hypothetical protein [bacterium]
HYLISIYDQNFEPVTIFGEKPPNWEGANVPEYPDPQQTYDNLIHSRMEHLYVLGDRVVYIYTTMNYNESRHLDYPRFCIYTLDGEPIAKGIPIDFGYYPDHFFCTSYGINSEKDRLILVKKENPENEDSLHKVGIFKPTWTLE